MNINIRSEFIGLISMVSNNKTLNTRVFCNAVMNGSGINTRFGSVVFSLVFIDNVY